MTPKQEDARIAELEGQNQGLQVAARELAASFNRVDTKLAAREAELAALRAEKVDCAYCLGCGQEGPSGEDCSTCWGAGAITARQVQIDCLKTEQEATEQRARAEQAEAELAAARGALAKVRGLFLPPSVHQMIDAALATPPRQDAVCGARDPYAPPRVCALPAGHDGVHDDPRYPAGHDWSTTHGPNATPEGERSFPADGISPENPAGVFLDWAPPQQGVGYGAANFYGQTQP